MVFKATAALALCAVLGLSGAARAQTYIGDGGQTPATAPGGTEGIDGRANEREAIRAGDAIPVAPGAGVEVERRAPAVAPAEEMPAPRR